MSKKMRTLKDQVRPADDIEEITARLVGDGVVTPKGDHIEGTLQHYYKKKQIGFILGADGKEYFLHVSRMAEGHRAQRMAKVKFIPVQHKGKFIAYDCRVVKD